MLRRLCLPLVAVLLAGGVSLHAQEPVVGVSDPEALFHSSDPKLDANKQAAFTTPSRPDPALGLCAS